MISIFFRARLKIYSFNCPITIRFGHFGSKMANPSSLNSFWVRNGQSRSVLDILGPNWQFTVSFGHFGSEMANPSSCRDWMIRSGHFKTGQLRSVLVISGQKRSVTVRFGRFGSKLVDHGSFQKFFEKSEVWLTLRNPNSIVKSFMNCTTGLGDPNLGDLTEFSSLIECQYDSKLDNLCKRQLISGIFVVIPNFDWSNLINALLVAIWLLALK